MLQPNGIRFHCHDDSLDGKIFESLVIIYRVSQNWRTKIIR
jgi:hypothetical protein